jgi:hypothetical protein
MPVAFDSSASNAAYKAGASTSGNLTWNHTTSSLASDVIVLVGVLFTSDITTTGASLTCTLGGNAMTPSGSVFFDTNQCFLKTYYTLDPTPGSLAVNFAYTSMPTEVITRNLMGVSLSYSGVEDIGTAVTNSGGTTTTSSVTVDGTAAAHRVISFHGVDGSSFGNINSYDEAMRARTFLFGGGVLLAGDAEGANGQAMTAHQNTTSHWAAIGVSLSPAPVLATAAHSSGFTATARGGIYREAPPAPSRYWRISPN